MNAIICSFDKNPHFNTLQSNKSFKVYTSSYFCPWIDATRSTPPTTYFHYSYLIRTEHWTYSHSFPEYPIKSSTITRNKNNKILQFSVNKDFLPWIFGQVLTDFHLPPRGPTHLLLCLLWCCWRRDDEERAAWYRPSCWSTGKKLRRYRANLKCRGSTEQWKKKPAWKTKCPIFLGNFTPKTSNYCLKNRALGFPGGCLV